MRTTTSWKNSPRRYECKKHAQVGFARVSAIDAAPRADDGRQDRRRLVPERGHFPNFATAAARMTQSFRELLRYLNCVRGSPLHSLDGAHQNDEIQYSRRH